MGSAQRAIVLGVALGIGAMAACGGQLASPLGDAGAMSESLGGVDLTIVVPQGFDGLADTPAWKLTRDGAVVDSGTFLIVGPRSQFVLADLVPSSNYALQFSATSNQGATCGLNAFFAVQAGAVIREELTLTCGAPPAASAPSPCNYAVCIDAAALHRVSPPSPGYQCPQILSLVAAPNEVRVGQTSTLRALVAGTISVISWAESENDLGFLTEASGPTTTFTCLAPGDVTITAETPADGDYCGSAGFTTLSLTLRCVPGPVDAGPDAR